MYMSCEYIVMITLHDERTAIIWLLEHIYTSTFDTEYTNTWANKL